MKVRIMPLNLRKEVQSGAKFLLGLQEMKKDKFRTSNGPLVLEKKKKLSEKRKIIVHRKSNSKRNPLLVKKAIVPGAKSRFSAYSSSPDETNGNPFITASGTHVHWGTVAANHLAFGTRFKIPSLFGDTIFIVEDRTASSHYGVIDIWFPSKTQALQFGRRRAEIVILW